MREENWIVKLMGLWLVVLYCLALFSSSLNAKEFLFSKTEKEAFEVMVDSGDWERCSVLMFKAMVESDNETANEMALELINNMPKFARDTFLMGMCIGLRVGYIQSMNLGE